MPAEVSDIEEFVRISERAEECRVKRREDIVKLKLRTPRKLYTIKLGAEQAADVLKRVKCEVIET
jgi:large subunit ribosomal protein L38e